MKPQDRKSEIVHISAELFKAKGYSAVTMRDIAQAMDIKAASLYNHIKSKQEILVLIIIEIAEEFTNNMSQIVNSEETAIIKLDKIIQLHIDITLRDPDLLACLNNDWMHLENENLNYFLKMREEYEQNFRKIVKTGILNNEIKNLNPEVIIFSMLSTLRTLYLWYGTNKTLNGKVLKTNMTNVLLNGII
jgi:TetR/AcrR family transcriptional regulator, cholesterol catabolism regulator